MLFAPVAFVALAEHIADHKNLGSIINRDLITDPGLDQTLLGDGVGSIVGAFFGGCPNTTYGESVGCVAITGNASVCTIFITAIYCIILSFFDPFVAFVNSIPTCIVGGVCIALYGFIAVSGLKMVQTGRSGRQPQPVRGGGHPGLRHRRPGAEPRPHHHQRHRHRADRRASW